MPDHCSPVSSEMFKKQVLITFSSASKWKEIAHLSGAFARGFFSQFLLLNRAEVGGIKEKDANLAEFLAMKAKEV